MIIENATVPQLQTHNPDPTKPKIKRLPAIKNELVVKNLKCLESIFQGWTASEIELFTIQEERAPIYKGPKSTYQEIKRLYFNRENNNNTIYFTDEQGNVIEGPYYEDTENNLHPKTTGSIQKQQSQLLALLQTQNKSRG